MEVVQAELEGSRFALAPNGVLHVRLHLLDDLFDARGMDAAVGDQPLDRLPGDLTPEGVEAGEDDGPGRIVDNQFHAGGRLERADVAPFTADDPAFHVVAGQIDDRHGRFDGMLGRAALNGVRDDLLSASCRRLARFGFEPFHEVGGVAPRVRFDLLD